jgi:hypothetical protein
MIFEVKYPNTDIQGRVVNYKTMAVYKIFPEKDASNLFIVSTDEYWVDEILDVSNLNFALDSNPSFKILN